MLQCVAVCCSVLQCVAVCRRNANGVGVAAVAHENELCNTYVLQCVVVCCSVFVLLLQLLQFTKLSHLPRVCYSVLQCVAVCCSVLQCVAVCSVLQCIAMCYSVYEEIQQLLLFLLLHTKISHFPLCVAVCCSVLQCGAVCCSVLQCVAVCCSVLQCVPGNATGFAAAVAAVAHKNALCHTCMLQSVAVCCSVLQCVAACC